VQHKILAYMHNQRYIYTVPFSRDKGRQANANVVPWLVTFISWDK